jgi:hypothetical protein
MVWNIILGSLLLIFFALTIAGLQLSGFRTSALIFGYLTLMISPFLVVNWLRGPTCKCFFQTAVQAEKLPSLNRLRKAHRVIARIRPLIENAQGMLTREAVARGMTQMPQPGGVEAISSPPRIAKPLRNERGQVHQALFYLLLIDTVHTIVSVFYHNRVITGLSGLMLLGYLGLLTTSLVKQTNSNLSVSVKRITWGVLAYFIVIMVWGISYAIYFEIEYPTVSHANALPINYPGALVMHTVIAGGSLLLGIFGLRRLYEFRQEGKSQGPLRESPPAS